MKAYAAKKRRPFDYFFEKRPAEEDFEGLIDRQVIGGKLPGSDLELEPIEHSAADEETDIAVLPEEQVDAEEEEEALSGVSMAPGQDFEEDHITCYLKEVSSFSLLTKERETELAQIIRNGRDELVQIVGDHADENTILSDLGDKVNKLLERDQIGSSFGPTLGQYIPMAAWQRITLIAAGTGAGIAATFNTPIGGLLFAVELMLHEVSVRTLVPVAISTATATYIGGSFLAYIPLFSFRNCKPRFSICHTRC
jgi:hypothetical protein